MTNSNLSIVDDVLSTNTGSRVLESTNKCYPIASWFLVETSKDSHFHMQTNRPYAWIHVHLSDDACSCLFALIGIYSQMFVECGPSFNYISTSLHRVIMMQMYHVIMMQAYCIIMMQAYRIIMMQVFRLQFTRKDKSPHSRSFVI